MSILYYALLLLCCRFWRPVWRTADTNFTFTCPPETLWRMYWSKPSCQKTMHQWFSRTESWSWYRSSVNSASTQSKRLDVVHVKCCVWSDFSVSTGVGRCLSQLYGSDWCRDSIWGSPEKRSGVSHDRTEWLFPYSHSQQGITSAYLNTWQYA